MGRGLGSAPPKALADIPGRDGPLLPLIGDSLDPPMDTVGPLDYPNSEKPLNKDVYDDVVYIPSCDDALEMNSHVIVESSIGGMAFQHSIPDDFDLAFYEVAPVYDEPSIPVTVPPPMYGTLGAAPGFTDKVPTPSSAPTLVGDRVDYSGTAPKYKPRSTNVRVGSRRIFPSSAVEEVSHDPYHNFTTAPNVMFDHDIGGVMDHELTPTEPPDDVIETS